MSYVAVAIGGSAVLGATTGLIGASKSGEAAKKSAEQQTALAVWQTRQAMKAQEKAQKLALAAQKEATAENVKAARAAMDEAVTAIQEASRISEQAVRAGADTSNAEFMQAYDTIKTQLAPWVSTGAMANEGLQNLSGLNGPEAARNAFTQDPGYQFRLDQGQKVRERSAAARGDLFSGKTGMELEKYGQDMGSQEFSNAFNRLLTLSEQGRSAVNTQSGYDWNMAGERSKNAWNVQNQIGQNALNEGNTKMQGAWNVANMQAGGNQNNANVAIQGARDTSNVANNNAFTIANAAGNQANVNAQNTANQWNAVNSGIQNAIGAGAMVYGLNNKPASSYNSTYSMDPTQSVRPGYNIPGTELPKYNF